MISQPPKSFAACNQHKVASRPAHHLNDRSVTLKAGATATPVFSGGAALTGGHGHVGLVWVVRDGKAVVDFGTTESGHGIRVVAKVEDLIESM